MTFHQQRPVADSALRRFVRRYGWRAYALPVLVVVTVVALVHTGSSSARTVPRAAAAGGGAGGAARSGGTAGSGTLSAASKAGSVVEGFDAGTRFRPGATPPAQVIDLGTDDVRSCSHNSYAQLIVVSIARQHLWACERHRQVDETAVTTGSTDNGDHTPLGSWRLEGKQRNRYLVGRGYRDYVHYWMPFNGDFGLHDATWQTMPFGSQRYHTEGSHGCVHVPTAMVRWLYHWARVGKTVVTIEQ